MRKSDSLARQSRKPVPPTDIEHFKASHATVASKSTATIIFFYSYVDP